MNTYNRGQCHGEKPVAFHVFAHRARIIHQKGGVRYAWSMQVHVLFFGALKDFAGHGRETLELPEGSTAGDVLVHYRALVPRFADYERSLAISVNREYAGPDRPLSDGDEVGLLPPVSGGLDEATQTAPMRRVALVRGRINSETLISSMKRPPDGAVVIFDGVVRDNSRGRRTLYLVYEAYEEMALKEIDALAAAAIGKFAVRDIAVVHRLGRIEIGETSVLIVVASAHRAPAFEACRWIIDTLKRTVPIWKKEYFEDGAVWADGEPFPPEITGD